MNASNPLRVMVFIVCVAFILALTAVIMPDKGVTIGGVKLKFVTSKELVVSKKQDKKDISAIVNEVNTEEQKGRSSIRHKNATEKKMGAPEVVNYTLGESSTGIQMSADGKQKLYAFFEKLNKALQEKNKLHILHFGDSQIEGDRMTSFIRQRFQEKFGGNGPGLVTANNVYPTLSYSQSYSPNFVRYTCFGGPKLSNRLYGVFNSAARFTPESVDAAAEEQEAWIEVGPNSSAHTRARQYSQVKMFYNSCTEPCQLQVIHNGAVIHEESLQADGKAHTVKLSFNHAVGNLKFVFRSRKSPNIVGFSLEGDYGVQVDNIAMRGSSGTFFGAINTNSFSEMLKELNTQLTIMQFGGNSMPYLKDSSEVRNYARYLQGQLQTLKRLKPDMAIILIGPSDMSKLIDGNYETYPLLPYCVEQLKKAALRCGANYWDLYETMGGKNSMPSWVEKGLGRSDHVHFSIKGATIAGQLFYEALIAEYLKFEVQ